MATPWIEAFPRTCIPFLQEMDELLGKPLSRIIAEGSNATLTATENAQPAIMAISIMVLRVLELDFGFRTADRVDVTLGHSLGEFAALASSGHLRYADALQMMGRRAEVMARCSREAARDRNAEYGMIALVCEPDGLGALLATVHEFLGHGSAGSTADSAAPSPPIRDVWLANINSKNQIVLSGNVAGMQALVVQLRQYGGHDPRAVRLRCDSAFHTPMMAPAAAAVRDSLARIPITFPAPIACVSNISARAFASPAELRHLLARQCVDTVRWWDCIRHLDLDLRVRRWLGIGPGRVGRNLVGKEVGMRGRDLVRGGGVWGVTDPKEIEPALRGLDDTEAEGGG